MPKSMAEQLAEHRAETARRKAASDARKAASRKAFEESGQGKAAKRDAQRKPKVAMKAKKSSGTGDRKALEQQEGIWRK